MQIESNYFEIEKLNSTLRFLDLNYEMGKQKNELSEHPMNFKGH